MALFQATKGGREEILTLIDESMANKILTEIAASTQETSQQMFPVNTPEGLVSLHYFIFMVMLYYIYIKTCFKLCSSFHILGGFFTKTRIIC